MQEMPKQQPQTQKPVQAAVPRAGPEFLLVPVPNDRSFGALFWTFKVTGSPSANWSGQLRTVLTAALPIGPGSTEAACVMQPIGITTTRVERGMKSAHVYFVHPSGYKVPVDAKLGTDGVKSMLITIDLRQGVLPASWYREGTFVLFKGKDCAF